MFCNDDRLLPVVRETSSKYPVLSSSGGSHDQVPTYLALPFSGGTEPPVPSTSVSSYQQDELSIALKLSPQVLRYNPVWRAKWPSKPPPGEKNFAPESLASVNSLDFLEGQSESRGNSLEFLESGSESRANNLEFLESQSESRANNLEFLESRTDSRANNLEFLESQSESRANNLEFLESRTESRANNLEFLEGRTESRANNLEFLESRTESRGKFSKVRMASVASLIESKNSAHSQQMAAKTRAMASARTKSHRPTRPTLAPMHLRRRSPHAVMEMLTKNSWTVDLARNRLLSGAQTNSKPAELNELQYLVAYNLVNNFYFNLVSWSPAKKSIAIAIDSKAYWWNGSGVVEDIIALKPRTSPVSCISCSAQGHFAVATLDGSLSVYSVTHSNFHMTRTFPSPVFTIEWFPDGVHFLVGDSCGKIYIMEYIQGKVMEVISQLYGFSQQICGFALNSSCTEVAAGANENLAIVWDISNLQRPLLKCKLPHTSAVKGISFCPWAPGLLATGAGSNDRHLRYWHTGSGQLLAEINTKRQITSVFWSSQVRQILVTFGYSTCEDHVVAAVYPYPGQTPVAEAKSRDSLRALSASVAPDESSVAVAANDGTIRVYSLWPSRCHSLTPAAASGSYGSAIIETVEQVDVKAVLR